MAQTDAPTLHLDSLLCFPLYATARAVSRAYASFLAEVGLTYPQYLVLLVLWEEGEPMTVGAIGDRLRLDSGTLTPLLKRLEAMGYVDRNRDRDDERRVLVGLTPAGERLKVTLADVPERLWDALGLQPSEAIALRDQLKTLLDRLEGPPAR